MRSVWIVALLVLSANLVAAPAAQAQAADKPLLTDPTGDTKATVLGSGGALGAPMPATGETQSPDLTSLSVTETYTSLLFTLGVAGLSDPTAFDLYQVHFDWKNMTYTAFVQYQVLPGGTYTYGYLTAISSDDKGSSYYSYGSYVANFDVKVDPAKGTFGFEIPKAYILDGLKRMPGRGDALTNVYVDSTDSLTLFNGGMDIVDRMPDADGAKLAMKIGDESHGNLLLQSPDRVRVSNGGAATFVYTVSLTNKGESGDTVDLVLRDLPPNWNGTVESPVKMPGHSTKTLTVLASVPFAHVHGGFSSFNLTAASETDPTSYAVLNMGILHTPIPQPAGHHDTLYIHPETMSENAIQKVFPYTTGIMNTEAPTSDEGAQEISLTGTQDGNGWTIPLNPALQMGISFDLSRTGTLIGNIAAHATPGDFKVAAKVLLASTSNGNTGKPIVLAASKPEDLTFSVNAATPFSLQLVPTEASAYIPYQQHQNMYLTLTLTGNGPVGCCIQVTSGTSPNLQVNGFKMVLPLNEYADRLTGISEAASAVDLKAEGPVEKSGRPGTLMTYNFALQNTGFIADTFVVETAGNDAKRGSLVPGGEITLNPKETRELTLGVEIPPNYKDSQSLEVLVFAHAKSDPSKMALQRTKTLVATTGNATSDETKVFLARQNEAKKSPGFDAILLVGGAAIAVGLASLRRKR